MDRPPPLRLPSLGLLLLAACGGGEGEGTPGPPPGADRPDAVVIPVPDRPVVDMGTVEDFSEIVANRFVDLADKLRRRDFDAARDWLDPAFAGHGWTGLGAPEVTDLSLGASRHAWDVSAPPVVGRAGFLDQLQAWIGPWERMETVVWKVKAAEFQRGTPPWGRVRAQITLMGDDREGGPRSIVAWAQTRVERSGGNWVLTHLALESLTEERRPAPIFTDVSAATGLAFAGTRFGQPGNKRFAWNGAAAGDADGDGLFDLFLPSEGRNFLYLARQEDGVQTFVEEGAQRGVGGPAGGTGCVFFDLEGDGDQDLALADVGWERADGSRGGNPLRFYRNDGSGSFDEVGSELGFDRLCYGYTLVVLDHDLDGALDLFLCNYGRQQDEPNNSWVQATNGMPNVLFANRDGRALEDVTEAVGIRDTFWSYAAAAADFDLDGDQDLYVANDYGRNQLWQNDGRGGFEDTADELGVGDLGNGMGASFGDLDSDGALDLYVANMSSTAGNRILRRLQRQDGAAADLRKMASGNSIFRLRGANGGARFDRLDPGAGGINGAWAWSVALFDLDLDGRLDVFNANGFVSGDSAADT